MSGAPVFPLLVIVPVKSAHEAEPLFLAEVGGGRLIDSTLAAAERQCERGEVVLCLTTDDARIADYVRSRNSAWQIKQRDREEASNGYFATLRRALDWARGQSGGDFRAVLILEPSHPFRPAGLIANAMTMLERDPQIETVVAVVREYGNLWTDDGRGRLHRMETPIGRHFFREMAGLCLLTRPATLIGRDAMGQNVGFVVIEEQWALIDIHGAEGVALARRFHGFLAGH